MQLEMGMSTTRYLPASGTAGLARSLVRGNNRVPCPPPMITESTLLVFADCRPVCDITLCKELYAEPATPARSSLFLARLDLPQELKRRSMTHAPPCCPGPFPTARAFATKTLSSRSMKFLLAPRCLCAPWPTRYDFQTE